jgi:hypothetical protein
MNQHKTTRHLRPQSVQNWARYEPFFPKDQKVPKTKCKVRPIFWFHFFFYRGFTYTLIKLSYFLPARCNRIVTHPQPTRHSLPVKRRPHGMSQLPSWFGMAACVEISFNPIGLNLTTDMCHEPLNLKKMGSCHVSKETMSQMRVVFFILFDPFDPCTALHM